MTDNDLQLLRNFRSEVPQPDEATALRIYRLATSNPRKRHKFALRVPRRPSVVIAAVAATLAVAGGASALAYHYLGPSPGFSAGFSAFNQLPPAPWPDSMPTVGYQHAAAYEGVSADEFLHGLRLLRTGLTLGPGDSQGQGALYAYIGDDGKSACMFLTGQGGSCFRADFATHVQGVMPQINPGYPGQTPALTAIVADNVKSVGLEISGKLTNLPIVNNSIYADLNGLHAGDTISLHVTYDDSSTAIDALLNPLS
jgi:hypothetical protein